METDRLIQDLAGTAEPVRALPLPWTRTAIWLAIALPYIALVVHVVERRSDLVEKIWQSCYLVEQPAALATGVAAAAAAFAATIPGYSRKLVVLAMILLAVWLGRSLQPDWFCFPAIVLVGAILAIAMVVMLRRGAPLMPCTTVALGRSCGRRVGKLRPAPVPSAGCQPDGAGLAVRQRVGPGGAGQPCRSLRPELGIDRRPRPPSSDRPPIGAGAGMSMLEP